MIEKKLRVCVTSFPRGDESDTCGVVPFFSPWPNVGHAQKARVVHICVYAKGHFFFVQPLLPSSSPLNAFSSG